MTFSLVLGTRGRTEELVRLFDSLISQSERDFEVIVVDQNEDDRLADLTAAYSTELRIRRIRVDSRGHAAANNDGLPFATGEIICFPDDDCWYPADLLSRVAQLFRDHPEWAGVTGRESVSSDQTTNRRFDLAAGEIDKRNIWRRHISFTMFFRKAALGDLGFNPELGIGAGTKWGAGEETDLLLRFMARRNRVFYDPSLVVCHPDWGIGPLNKAYYRKARAYGMGMGHLLRLYRFPAGIVLRYLVRPAGGVVLSLFRGRPDVARYYREVFIGRLAGWRETGRTSAGPVT